MYFPISPCGWRVSIYKTSNWKLVKLTDREEGGGGKEECFPWGTWIDEESRRQRKSCYEKRRRVEGLMFLLRDRQASFRKRQPLRPLSTVSPISSSFSFFSLLHCYAQWSLVHCGNETAVKKTGTHILLHAYRAFHMIKSEVTNPLCSVSYTSTTL